jgi:hypothetical protein
MPGFMPGIHVLLCKLKKDVDGRDKPGHDVERMSIAAMVSVIQRIAACVPGETQAAAALAKIVGWVSVGPES